MDEDLRRLQKRARYDPEAAAKLRRLQRRASPPKAIQRQLDRDQLQADIEEIERLKAEVSALQPGTQVFLTRRKNAEGEYRITWKINGKFDPNKTYHTTDWSDAVGTLRHMVAALRPKQRNPLPERDAEARRQARQYYDQLLTAVTRGSLWRHLEPITVVVRGRNVPGLALPWSIVDPDITEDHPLANLEIIFTYQKSSANASFFPPVNQYPMAILLYNCIYNVKGYEDKLRQSETRESMIHEFTHLLDHQRRQRKILSYIDSSDPRYFTSPSEFNAYYQTGFHQLEQAFTDRVRWTPTSLTAMLRRLYSTNSFKEVAVKVDDDLTSAGKLLIWDNVRFNLERYWHKDFIQSLRKDPAWLQRFLKRLRLDFEAWKASHHQQLVELEKALEETIFELTGDTISNLKEF